MVGSTVSRWGFLLGGALSGLALTAWSADNDATLTMGTGLDFSHGTYGSTSATETWFVPVTVKYERGPATYKMTIPYVRITAPTGGTLVGYDDKGRPIYSGGAQRTTNEGLGDVVLGYGYSVVEQADLLVEVGAKVKLPTADADKNLGSGKLDYSGFVDLYLPRAAWTPFTTVGYRVIGEPAGVVLNNVWFGTLGLAYKHSRQDNFGAMWDIRQASTAAGHGVNEATAYWVHKFAGGFKMQAYAVAGFSDASPDYGLGLMLSSSLD